MADTVTPSSGNPYLALLQQEAQPPGWAQILQHIGNLGFGLAGGFGQAASQGLQTMAAIGPGLMMGNQLNAQAAHQAEQERMKRLELQFQAQAYEDKRADVLRKQKALELFAGGGGFNVTPQQAPLMGPTPQGPTTGSYDTKVAGLEGATKSGGMVFNELGSGAFGPYQFMPATWAAVRAQNPSLNLPEDMTTASREQHDAAHGAFKASNAQGLQAGGFQPTPENLYLAHRFGLGGALSVLRADPDKPLHEVLPIDWQRQNPDMRGQTAGGFRRLAAERVGGSSVPYVVRPDAKPTQYSGPVLVEGEEPPPSSLTPVMPQPKWETPGDIVPVNPAAWFPQQPAAAPVPGGQPGQPSQPAVPGGPNVVQAQYQPQPGQPTMAPGGGGPAPGGVDAPPTYVPPPVPRLDPQTEARINAGVAGGIITPEKGIELKRQIVEDQYKKAEEAAKAQHATALEVYKQRQESRRHERGLTEQKAAEERRIAEERRKHELSREEEGQWVRGDDGVERFVPKKDLKPGMTRIDKPAEPPPGYRKTADGNFEIIPGGPADVAAKAGEAKQTAEQTKAKVDDENKLRDDFDKAKPVQAYRTVVPMLESARQAGPTRAGDLNLIYAFAKLMDPESVVRESETGMVTATGTFGDKLAGLTSQLSGGAQLTPETRAKLLAELDTRFAGLKQSYEAHEEAYRGIAERRGLDFNNIRIPIRTNKPAEDKPATPPAGTFPAPPPAAVKALQMAPNQREDFDKMFGPGAAAKVLGR